MSHTFPEKPLTLDVVDEQMAAVVSSGASTVWVLACVPGASKPSSDRDLEKLHKRACKIGRVFEVTADADRARAWSELGDGRCSVPFSAALRQRELN